MRRPAPGRRPCVAVAVQRRVDGEPVVVGRDLDLARRAVHDGLVDAAVAVLQLVGAEAEGPPEQLVAEADAEERDAPVEHLAQQRHLGLGRRRVAGAVGEEHPVGAVLAHREHVVDGRRGRQHVHLDAALGPCSCGRHRLDAEVDGGHGEALLADGGDGIRLARASPRRRARRPSSRGSCAPSRGAPRRACAAAAPLKRPTRMAPRSRRWRVSARVSTSQTPTTPWSTQLVLEVAGGAPVGRRGGRGRARRSRRPRCACSRRPRR